MRIFFACLVLTLFVQVIYGTQTFEIRAECAAQDCHRLCSAFADEITIQDFSINADIVIDRQELQYLFAIQSPCTIQTTCFYQGIMRLMQKKQIKRLIIRIDEATDGILLHLDIIAGWVRGALIIKGLRSGILECRGRYEMEYGDLFDETKHRTSIRRVTEYLQSKGYLNVVIHERLERHHASKSIAVYLIVLTGKRFTIGSCDVQINSDKTEVCPVRNVGHNQVILSYAHQLRGCSYSRSLIAEQTHLIKKQLVSQGFCAADIMLTEQINYALSQVNLCWRIIPGTQRRFYFFGNHNIDEKQLLSQLSIFGRSVAMLPPSILAQELVQFYRQYGYRNAQISGCDSAGDVHFVISEGHRARIDCIELQGIDKRYEEYVRKRFFSPLINCYVSQREITQAVDAAVDYCISRGLTGARVVEHKVLDIDCSQDQALVCARITFDQEVGCDVFTQDTLLAQRLNDIKALDSQMPSSDHGCRFGKIIVTTSGRIPFTCIMQSCVCSEYEHWSYQKATKMTERLRSLGIFERVMLEPVDVVHNPHVRDILLQIEPDDPFEVRLRTGIELQQLKKYQMITGLAGTVGGTLLIKNPSNQGDLVTIEADIARFHHEVSAEYRKPYPWCMPCDLRLRAYHTLYNQPGFIGDKRNLYSVTRTGALWGLYSQGLYCDAGINFGMETSQTRIPGKIDHDFMVKLSRVLDFEPMLLDRTIPYLLAEPVVYINFLDDPLQPTSGSFSFASLRIILPFEKKYEQMTMIKCIGEHAFFISKGSLVSAFRLRVGHIFRRHFMAIPPVERFYLGGSHSLRGYAADLAPPLGILQEGDCTLIVPRGGKTIVNANVELRYMVSQEISGVLFTDIGCLSDGSPMKFSKENILATSGFGCRLKTPLGPLRFDIGFKWHQSALITRYYEWYLTFGQAF